MKVVAIIPVHERLPLLPFTIGRLLKKNRVNEVICVGSENERNTCENAGAIFIEHENILSNKWNAGFLKAKELNPDLCLFVGSSDWLCDDYLDRMIPKLYRVDMVGVKHFYQAHITKDKIKLGLWTGYGKEREYEPIGIGRILTKEILDKIGWQPFQPNRSSSMDYYMFHKLKDKGALYLTEIDEMVKVLSISTDAWGNKHKFGKSFDGEDFYYFDHHPTLINEFPELTELKQKIWSGKQ
jgi:hypothetical protein